MADDPTRQPQDIFDGEAISPHTAIEFGESRVIAALGELT